MDKQNSEPTAQKLDPIGQWLEDSLSYVFTNWKMLAKVYLFSILAYMGTALLISLAVGIIVYIAVAMGFSWNIATGLLTGVAVIALLLLTLSLAGKMLLMQLYAVQAPVLNIRERWKQIKLQEGLAIYWIFILSALAFYSGLILFIIPGLILGVWISTAIFVKINDRVSGLKAIIHSRDYARGLFWPILGRLLLYGLAMIGLTILLLFIYSKMLKWGFIWGALGYAIYMIAILILSIISYRLLYALYLNLVKIKGKLNHKISGWRVTKWGIFVCWPIVVIILISALTTINPLEQIRKAGEVNEIK